MSTDRSTSIVNLSNLLEEVVRERNFSSFPTLTEEVLRSQSGLAEFSHADREIVGTSLNTLKASATRYLAGGFEELDGLRKTALEYRIRFDAAMQSDVKPRTKLALQQKIDELELVESTLSEDLFFISEAFYQAIKKARGIIESTQRDDLKRRWKDEEAALLAMASMVRAKVQRVV